MAETVKHHNRCGRDTNHHVRGKHDQSGVIELGDPEDGSYSELHWWEEFQILQCAGCELVGFRKSAQQDDDPEPTVTSFPPKVSRSRPKWLSQVPPEMRLLLVQTYQALDANSRALAMMGARAVADMLLVTRVGDVGGFAQKLDAMEVDGHLTSASRRILEAALETGNAAAHRGHQPSVEDVDAVMAILENLLEATYHLEPLADALRQRTPARPPRS